MWKLPSMPIEPVVITCTRYFPHYCDEVPVRISLGKGGSWLERDILHHDRKIMVVGV